MLHAFLVLDTCRVVPLLASYSQSSNGSSKACLGIIHTSVLQVAASLASYVFSLSRLVRTDPRFVSKLLAMKTHKAFLVLGRNLQVIAASAQLILVSLRQPFKVDLAPTKSRRLSPLLHLGLGDEGEFLFIVRIKGIGHLSFANRSAGEPEHSFYQLGPFRTGARQERLSPVPQNVCRYVSNVCSICASTLLSAQ